MPLYKRKPFALAELPNGLNPNESVFQIRFTKEIFRDYKDYLNRLNLYRQRVWTCKATRKGSLTYEEALVSEHQAAEDFQQIPVDYVIQILQTVQYSTLTLKDLEHAIITKLQGYLFQGLELHGRKGESICPCRILKLEESGKRVTVGWLDKHKSVVDTSTVDPDCLVWKKLPISRSLLKSFVRESTCQTAPPWVVHEKLAEKYGLRMDPPVELRKLFYGEDGNENGYKLKKRKQTNQDQISGEKKTRMSKNEQEQIIEEPIKYPIDDLLVKPGADDPVFSIRPLPSKDFIIPVECVGDLLMVWSFCSSFGKLLKLWPFSLEDFEKSLCHRDAVLPIMLETHSALLNILIKDGGEYTMVVQRKKRKSKITLTNWNEYLGDFLELKPQLELLSHISTIKRGHYSLLDVCFKLKMLSEIVNDVLNTDVIRNMVDLYHKGKHIFSVAKREAQVMREDNGTEKDRLDSHEHSVSDVLATNVNTTSHTGECTHIESGQVERKFKTDTQIDENETPQNKNINLEVYSRNDSKKSKQNVTISMKICGSIEADESQKKNHSKKEKGQENQEKTDEQKKQHNSREKERQNLRENTLGKDRDYNRYWFFRREGRIFVESLDSKQWGFYSTKEELDSFIASLNPKGVRERALQVQLRKHYDRISLAMQKRSKDLVQRVLLEEAVLRRSTRVRAQPRDSQATSYLRYTNYWKEA